MRDQVYITKFQLAAEQSSQIRPTIFASPIPRLIPPFASLVCFHTIMHVSSWNSHLFRA